MSEGRKGTCSVCKAPSTYYEGDGQSHYCISDYAALKDKADRLADALVGALDAMRCLGRDLEHLNTGKRIRLTALLCLETYEDCEQALKEYRGEK